MTKLNLLGGIDDQSEGAKKRAKDVDLITLPIKIKGTNCSNCKWSKKINDEKSYCENKRVEQFVNARMCCVLWTAPGEHRSFKGRENIYE